MSELIALRCELRGPLHALGQIAREARELERCLDDARALGDVHHAIRVQVYLSNLYRHRGAVDAALRAAETAWSDAAESGERELTICAGFDLAQAHLACGRLHDAAATSEASVAMITPAERAEAFGRPAPAGVLLRYVHAEALAQLGRLDDAHVIAAEGAELADELDVPFGRAASRWPLALIAYWQGEFERAVALLEWAHEFCLRQRIPVWAMMTAGLLAEIRARQGQSEQALRLVRKAQALNGELGYDLWTGRFETLHGYCLSCAGEHDEAEARVLDGTRAAANRDKIALVWCDWIAGNVLRDREQARHHLSRAVEAATRLSFAPCAALASLDLESMDGVYVQPSLDALQRLGMGGHWRQAG